MVFLLIGDNGRPGTTRQLEGHPHPYEVMATLTHSGSEPPRAKRTSVVCPNERVLANYRWRDTPALTPGETMGIGAGIVLIAIGAILAFAVNFSVSGIEISTVGFILMVAGVIGIVVALVMNSQRARTQHTIVRDDRLPPGDGGPL